MSRAPGMPDPLQELAAAARQPVTVHVHNQTPDYALRKGPSPFSWGFGVTLGVIAALVLLSFCFAFVRGCDEGFGRELQYQRQQQVPVVTPPPAPRPVKNYDWP